MHALKVSKVIVDHFMKKPCVICDLGCGSGQLANSLSEEGHQVIGVDLSQKRLDHARAADKTRAVAYLQADAHGLPFEAKSFEAVTFIKVLEEVSDPQQAICEVARILKPGGVFFFQTSYFWHLCRSRRLKEWCQYQEMEIKQIPPGRLGYAIKR